MNPEHHSPPEEPSNEAEPQQLDIARGEGRAYLDALQAMEEESGAVLQSDGDYVVALVQEEAEGMYGIEDGHLLWREAPDDANGHLEVAVADAGDGRFVPELDVTVTVVQGEQVIFSGRLPFLWHPFLYHYGTDFTMPQPGRYTVHVRIGAPTFMRHDPINGHRYAEPVDVVFTDVEFTPGRKPSPHAQPRGTAAPHAG